MLQNVKIEHEKVFEKKLVEPSGRKRAWTKIVSKIILPTADTNEFIPSAK